MAQEPKTIETLDAIAESFDKALNSMSETIGYLRSLTVPFLTNPCPRELANRLETSRDDLHAMIAGEIRHQSLLRASQPPRKGGDV
jgi:hypothetical protein